ncbi:MAG: hypothetical protein N2746_12160 [Deltaproteobacteria bacterium]|nr:hypothetical protein [Deltaproteobacteria bacterium]
MVSDIDAEFASQLRQLQYMSNITILLYTRKNLANYYWVNIADREVRLTGIISQSNLVRYPSAKGFFTYVSIYLPRDDKLLMVDSSQMLKFILQELCKMDISLKESEIFEFYVTRTEYAQPIYIADNDLVLSSLVTPISGIYVLNNHSILPEDRGLNNIVCKAKILSNLIPRAH